MFKPFHVCFLLLMINSSIHAQTPSPPQTLPTTRPRIINSPEILPDHRVTFRILAPKSSDISISGDFGPSQKLSKADDGLWSITIGPLTPDLYSYSFSIDSVKTIDPRNPSVKPGIAGLDNTVFIQIGRAHV